MKNLPIVPVVCTSSFAICSRSIMDLNLTPPIASNPIRSPSESLLAELDRPSGHRGVSTPIFARKPPELPHSRRKELKYVRLSVLTQQNAGVTAVEGEVTQGRSVKHSVSGCRSAEGSGDSTDRWPDHRPAGNSCGEQIHTLAPLLVNGGRLTTCCGRHSLASPVWPITLRVTVSLYILQVVPFMTFRLQLK